MGGHECWAHQTIRERVSWVKVGQDVNERVEKRGAGSWDGKGVVIEGLVFRAAKGGDAEDAIEEDIIDKLVRFMK